MWGITPWIYGIIFVITVCGMLLQYIWTQTSEKPNVNHTKKIARYYLRELDAPPLGLTGNCWGKLLVIM